MIVSDGEKRWLAVGIAINKVVCPVLRDYIKRGMDTQYAKLDIYCSGLTTPCSLKTLTFHHVNTDPSLKHLKFQNINNNLYLHGKQKNLYNYNVNSSVDFAKLFLPDYSAEVSEFDESLDMSAILHLLGFNNPVPMFPSPNPLTSIQTSADEVSKNVWRKWCHCNVTDWTEVLFNHCFIKLETLVRSLRLTGGIKETSLNKIADWQRKGRYLVMGHAMDQNLLSLVQQELKELIEKFSKVNSKLALQSVPLTETVTDLQEQPLCKRARLYERDACLDAEEEKLQKGKKTSKEAIEIIIESVPLTETVTDLQEQPLCKRARLYERDACLDAKEEKLQKGKKTSKEEIEIIMERLVSIEKIFSDCLASTSIKVKEMEKGFSKADDKVEQLKQELAKTDEKVKQLQQEFAKADDKVEQLEQELAKKDDKLEQLEQDFAKTDDKVEQLEQGFAKTDDKVEQLEQGFAKTDDKVKQLEQGFAKTDEKVKQLEQDFAKRDDKVEQLEQGFAKTDDKVGQLEQGFAKTDYKVVQLEQGFAKTDDKVVQLEQGFAKTDDKVVQLKRGFAKTDDKEEQLEQESAKTDDQERQLELDILPPNEKEHKSGASNVATFNVETWQMKLAEHYQKPAKVGTTMWSSTCQADLDQTYTPLSWVREKEPSAGSSQKDLNHYTELFTEKTKKGAVPKRILVQGETGIGKTTFVKKLLLDWSNLKVAKMEEAEEREDALIREDDEDIIEDKEESSTDDENMDKESEYGTKMGEKEQGALRKIDDGKLASSKYDQETTEDTEKSIAGDDSSNGEGDDNKIDDIEESSTDDEDMNEDIEDDVEMDEEQKEALRKFELAIAVNLKEVSECQTLRDIISGSHLFPKEDGSLIDDLLCYIYENQDKVLLVLDGYNEYRIGRKTDSRINSPICSVFHGNDLPNCTVLMTTRFSRADELLGSADIHVKITGFNTANRDTFMRKMLHSETRMESVREFIDVSNLEDLARVPLLTRFFCLLEKNEKKRMECGERKSVLYDAIIKHFLQHGHKKHSLSQVSEQNETYYQEILLEIEKVALEGVLKGDLVFKYGHLPVKVRSEEGVIVGLLQVFEYGPSLEPAEVVSFIHKSIQEYLAACYITHRWVPEGSLGGLEQRTRTLEDCEAVENVFQFICGLSDKGAKMVFQHFKSVRISDPTLDFSQKTPDVENETDVPLFDVTERHERFSAMVFDCFNEVQSRSELFRLCLDCTCRAVIVPRGRWFIEGIPEVKHLTSEAHSGIFFLVYEISKWNCYLPPRSDLFASLEILECLDVPLKITEYSEVLKAEDFLKKYLNVQCEACSFRCILCFRNGQRQFYITDLDLHCDDHASLFTKTTAISSPSISENLPSDRSCLKFLKSLNYYGNSRKMLKDLSAVIRDCSYMKQIALYANNDCVCDLLKQVLNASTGSIKTGPVSLSIQGRIKTETDELAALLPKFNVILLNLDLEDCSAMEVNTLVSSITQKSLEVLRLDGITSTAVTTLGRALPEMSSLKRLNLITREEEILQAECVEALFGGFYKALPLLRFDFDVTGSLAAMSLAPLIKRLCFFPKLKALCLSLPEMLNDSDLQFLLENLRFIPNLRELTLSHGLGHLVTSLVRFIDELPHNLELLVLDGVDCSDEDLSYVREELKQKLPQLHVQFNQI